MDSTFIQARITATEALIVAYETAVEALVSGQVQEYTLDTGQDRQTVTKINLTQANKTLDILYNRLATLEARLNGSGSVHTRPAW